MDADSPPVVIFKGGTSLSRGLKLTHRFSDDIDIMLKYDGNLSPNGIDRKILKPLAARTAEELGSSMLLAESTTGFKRNVRLSYPTRFGAGAHSEGVLLEMAVRGPGSVLPGTVTLTLQSYIGAYLDSIGDNPFDDTQPFEALVLSPVRTLIEKLSLLHGKAEGWEERDAPPTDVGRHYYDVHRLLSDDKVVAALANLTRDEFQEIRGAMEEATRKMKRVPPAIPDAGYAASLAFNPTAPYTELLTAEFADAEGLIFDEMPSLDECCDLVRTHLTSDRFAG